MRKISLAFSLVLYLYTNLFSQQSYFPLEVGNYWQFKGTYYSSYYPPSIFYDYMKVLGEIELGSPPRTFKLVKAFIFAPYYLNEYQFLDYDSTINSIIEYSVWEDTTRILFDFNAELFKT